MNIFMKKQIIYNHVFVMILHSISAQDAESGIYVANDSLLYIDSEASATTTGLEVEKSGTVIRKY